MNRSKRPPNEKSKIRLERQRLLNDDDIQQNIIWKSLVAETFHNEDKVRKRLGKVIGVRGESEANYKAAQLKTELDEVCFATRKIPTIWSAQEVFQDEGHVIELVSNLANGKSCFDLLNCKRESGQVQFYCEYMCPFLATKCLSRCIDALNQAAALVPSGYHGNIKPQNMLLHFEPATYMDSELSDLLRKTTLETYIPTTEEISLLCNVYLSDFKGPGQKSHRFKTKKQDLKESESFDELPHFSLSIFESEVSGEESKFMLTHMRTNEEIAKHHADDIWALASSVVTISTGIFILRDENRKRILNKKWTMDWEEEQMDEKSKHAWQLLPSAVRNVLKAMLDLDWRKRPNLKTLNSNPFLEDYKDACRRAKEEYHELQVCCVEVSYHRWIAEQQIKVLEDSIPKNPELDLKVGEALREAAKVGDLLTLQEILHIYHGYSKVIDNIDNSLNRTPLMLAASRGNVECVKSLIEHNADLMVRTKAHDTAVVFAIEHGHLEVTRLLVEAMEDKRLVAANDRRWWTPLHFAVYHNCFKITKMLLEKGIGGSARTRDASGRVPEEYVGYKITACDRHAFHLEPKEQAIKDLLIKFKDNKMIQDPFRLQEEQENDHEADSNGGLFCEHEMTVLDKFHNALHSRKLNAEALLESGLLRATVLPVNAEITSQMRLAAEQGSVTKLLQYLEKYGHNPNLVNHPDNGHGWTAAHFAAMRGRDACLKVLYSYGASLVLPEKRGALPIHFAVVNGHYSTTKLLLELLSGEKIDMDISSDEVVLRKEILSVLKKGYPLKNKSGSGWTVLHHAAAHDFVEIAQLLVKCGANPKWKDSDGKSCSDLVHSTKMALLFEKHINKQFEARRRRSSLKSRRGLSGDNGTDNETLTTGGETRKRSISGGSRARRRLSSVRGDRTSRGSVGSVGSLERSTGKAMTMNDLGSALDDSDPSTLPTPPVLDNRVPSPTMAPRRRLSSSAYIVNLDEKEILLDQKQASPPQIVRDVVESSPLSIDEVQPMLVTFAEGHTEVTIERTEMSPVFHDHNVSVLSTPQGVVPMPMLPTRSPSFSRKVLANNKAKDQADKRKSSVHDQRILKENVVPTPPVHLESALSLERRISSALATGKPVPEAIPPVTPPGKADDKSNKSADDNSTCLSSCLSDEDEDEWSDDEDDEGENDELNSSVTNSITGSARSRASICTDTNAPEQILTPGKHISDARLVFDDVSASLQGSINGSVTGRSRSTTPSGIVKTKSKFSEKKSKRKREKFHSLKDLDLMLTRKAKMATELKFQSEVAKELFTVTAVMLATPAWQRNLLNDGHGEEESKSEGYTVPEDIRTVVSLQSLQDITQKFVSTRARSLVSAVWEAADTGATDRLRTLLNQVGDGPKARHFNVVGGAESFDINDLSQMDEKCVCSPLYAAAKKGHTECARLLLDAGADSGYRDREGMTPLHVAAIWGRTGIIRCLVEMGADIDAKDFKGNTPLHRACFKYVKHSIATLTELGCNVTLKNKAGKRADEATKYSASKTAILNGVKKRGY